MELAGNKMLAERNYTVSSIFFTHCCEMFWRGEELQKQSKMWPIL
uniref:Uncharacterized protein n=1 Tax=Anguilla anguilla TaxID=7936 RepID=A0A0E9P8N3_ANGAN